VTGDLRVLRIEAGAHVANGGVLCSAATAAGTDTSANGILLAIMFRIADPPPLLPTKPSTPSFWKIPRSRATAYGKVPMFVP